MLRTFYIAKPFCPCLWFCMGDNNSAFITHLKWQNTLVTGQSDPRRVLSQDNISATRQYLNRWTSHQIFMSHSPGLSPLDRELNSILAADNYFLTKQNCEIKDQKLKLVRYFSFSIIPSLLLAVANTKKLCKFSCIYTTSYKSNILKIRSLDNARYYHNLINREQCTHQETFILFLALPRALLHLYETFSFVHLVKI